jgi:hypothetical protein
MTAAIANLALNVIMVALLVATIAYCWLLNRRIKVLQDSKSELAHLLRHFDESTQRASESIVALQTASKKIGENMQSRIDKANFLLDDLSFMIEKGNKVANQMEASFAVGRARSKVFAETPQTTQDDDVRWEPEDLLPDSLQKAARASAAPVVEEKPVAPKKSSSSLGAVLERLGNRPQVREDKKAVARHRADDPRLQEESERPRSKIEQELLEMLRAGVKG